MILAIGGCSLALAGSADGAGGIDPAGRAVAVLHPTEGHNVRGTVTFTRTDAGTRVVAEVAGLKPGPHGFHVHAFGDCSAGNGKSAGGHFNPYGMPHAGPDAGRRHVGDLGNIVADATGRAKLNVTDAKLALDGPASIVGRAVIVHGGADDMKSQPSGAAGPRVACGVIGIASDSTGR